MAPGVWSGRCKTSDEEGRNPKGNATLLILTFEKPTCPTQLQFDYVSYKMRRYIPNPMLCNQCGKYGHVQTKYKSAALCLKCGDEKHEGDCTPKCIHCTSDDKHPCYSRERPVWRKEKEVCEIKVTQDISCAHARREYEKKHPRPTVPSYSTILQTSQTTQQQNNLCRYFSEGSG